MLRKTWLVPLTCTAALGLALLPPACSSSQEVGATSAGGGGAGSGGCDCTNHGECIDYYQLDPMNCLGHLDVNDCSGHWKIWDSTCAGIADGDYDWSRGQSMSGCACWSTHRPDAPRQVSWPTCGDAAPCRGLPFRIVHDADPAPDPSCSYQCSGQLDETLSPPSGPATCTGPNGESCTLMFNNARGL